MRDRLTKPPQCITLDHIYYDHPWFEGLAGLEVSATLARDCCLVYDVGSDYVDGWAFGSRSQKNAYPAVEELVGPDGQARLAYSDYSGEIRGALRRHNIKHGRSTLGEPATNSLIETRVRLVTDGTCCVSLKVVRHVVFGIMARGTIVCFEAARSQPGRVLGQSMRIAIILMAFVFAFSRR